MPEMFPELPTEPKLRDKGERIAAISESVRQAKEILDDPDKLELEVDKRRSANLRPQPSLEHLRRVVWEVHADALARGEALLGHLTTGTDIAPIRPQPYPDPDS